MKEDNIDFLTKLMILVPNPDGEHYLSNDEIQDLLKRKILKMSDAIVFTDVSMFIRRLIITKCLKMNIITRERTCLHLDLPYPNIWIQYIINRVDNLDVVDEYNMTIYDYQSNNVVREILQTIFKKNPTQYEPDEVYFMIDYEKETFMQKSLVTIKAISQILDINNIRNEYMQNMLFRNMPLHIIKEVHDMGVDIYHIDGNGNNLLMFAIDNCNFQMFKYCLSFPEMNVNIINRYGEYPLLLIIQDSLDEYAQVILRRKDLNKSIGDLIYKAEGATLHHLISDKEIHIPTDLYYYYLKKRMLSEASLVKHYTGL